MQTKINWFEIPSTDFARAVKCYETLFDAKLKVENFGASAIGVFTGPDGDGLGCVINGENYVPGADGVVLYLDAGASIDTVIGRIEAAGCRIKAGKTELPQGMGFVAYFIDTEGNRLGLHAMA